MKKIYFLFVLFCFSCTSVIAQNSYLPTSSSTSEFALIYKLKDSKIAFQNKDIIDILDRNKTDLSSFMTLVDSVEINDKLNKIDLSDKMEYGHYLTVWTEKEILKVKLTTVSPLHVVIQNNAKRAWLVIYDSLGKELPNLKVKLNHELLPYNKKLKSYDLPNQRKEVTIKIEYAGQTWHLIAKKETKYRIKRPFFKKVVYSFPIKYFWIVPYREVKKVIRAIDRGYIGGLGVVSFFVELFTQEDEYAHRSSPYFNGKHYGGNGYIVMDKLKYRPLDTVRFKTYLVDKKGMPIEDDELDFFITKNGYSDKKIQSIKSYRKGGFESEIVLVDSLQFKLKDRIGIVLKNKKENVLISKEIIYEDYILPEIKSFEVETTDKNHYRNAPFALRINAKDFNNLPILDGKVNVELQSTTLTATYEPFIYQEQIVWQQEQILEPFGETLIYIPDSIFPAADLTYIIKVVLHNSNNERFEKEFTINYNYFTKKPNLKVHFEDGFVHAVYREGKDSVSKKGIITRYFKDNLYNESTKKDSIQFPFKEKVNTLYHSFDFNINTEEYEKNSFLTEQVKIPNKLYIEGNFIYDSLIITIKNPFESMVRYSLFCKNKLIEKKADSSSLIRIAIKDKYKKVYIFQTSYTFGGINQEDQEAFLRNRKQLFVSLDAPLLTSPSLKEKINITVTDNKKQPVKDADLTVVATNGKFEDYTKVIIATPQKSRFKFKSKKKISEIELKNQEIKNKNLALYPYWKNRLGLDSIAYYNFIFPKKEGFRSSIPYQNLYDLLQIKLENSWSHAYYLKDEFKQNHDLNTGGVFLFFLKKADYQDIAWIKVDGNLAYLPNINPYQDHLLTLSEGIHKLEIRFKNSVISIDSISVPMGNETILSYDLNNLPNYVHRKYAKSKLSHEEKMMLASHTFLGVTTSNRYSNGIMQIQQGKGEIMEIYSTSDDNYTTEKKHYKWYYPLLNKGEFRILRESSDEWDTLYFEPFVFYDIPAGKYVETDSSYEFDKGKISTDKTFLKKSFFPSYKFVQTNKTEDILELNYMLPFFDYSFFEMPYYKRIFYEQKPYKWTTPQVQVITTRDWGSLVFKDSDSLSENFEKEYIFKNSMPFKGKLPAGIYQVLLCYLDTVKETCTKINSLQIPEYSSKLPLIIIDFDKSGIDYYGQDNAQKSYNSIGIKLDTLQPRTENYYDEYDDARNGKIYGGKVVDSYGRPFADVRVSVKGKNRSTITDSGGNYSIMTTIGSVLVFNFIDDRPIEITTSRYNFDIDVDVNNNSGLSEVVVMSYQSRNKNTIDYSLSDTNGDYLIDSENNLLPLNPLNLESKNLDVNDYFAPNKKKSIRNYFTDNAIWQPTLRTDENGKASFEVTYPDDITSWKTLAIAYGEENKSGQALAQTSSFLTLSGQLSLPRFLIEGDSVRIIGKIASYSSDSIKVNSYFDLEGKKIPQKERKILFSSVDSLRFSVADNSSKTVDLSIDSLASLHDSVTIQYVMNADIAKKQLYTDGEERKIPIFKKGILQKRGFFAILDGDTTLDLRAFKNSLSTQNLVKLYVNDNILEVMISELENIQNYAYVCNEQKASKIRAYMLEKDIKTILKLPFTDKKQKELEELIKKLVKSQYNDGWWGWWGNSAPNTHMTAYIYGVMFDAKQNGYAIPEETLTKTENILKSRLFVENQNIQVEIYTALAKKEIYQKMYKDSVEKLTIALQIQEDVNKYHSFYNQLSILRLRQLYDLPISLDILESKQKKSIFGGIYWQESDYTAYYSIFRNNIQLNILAYQILRDAKTENAHSIDLSKVRQYFLENRNQNGYWRSTHESASILSTILSDFDLKNENILKSELRDNDKNLLKATEYVFSKENLPNQLVKKGLVPVFVSLSQDYFVAQTTKRASEDFHIKTYFKDSTNSDSIYLTAGKPTILKVEVTAQRESEYVSIEVPIPASCVYGKNPYSLNQSYYYYYRGIESYREEFKHKTVIFCTKIPAGTHTFEIILEPRYSGVFTLNPASVELMYFPSISGNEETKKIFVE